ncbi:MAG: endolytic transglycosylase MltG [Sulfurovum sp.]|nr:endolytic transglycosylase MltG [Sulfurovum sp.]
MPKTFICKKYIRILHYFQFFVALVMLIFLYNFVPISKNATETFYLEGENKQGIVTSLEAQGYTLTFIDKVMLDFDALPKRGWYTLKKQHDGRYAFFKDIYKHKAKTMNIVIYAAETHTEIVRRLANDMKLNEKELQKAYKAYAPFREASIFSGHYKVARKVKEETLIRYLVNDSQKVLDFFIAKSFTNPPDHLEVKILLTIASIIQKESNAISEMPTISAVIYNRLKKKMRLQMDSTLNYGKFSHTIVTPERIKTDTSYYNTYKHKGLPPHPMASISIDALRAAMFPEDCKHLFFMLKPSGKHVFCESYEEHLTNIRTFRAYQKKREEEKKKLAEEKLAQEKLIKEKLSEEKRKKEVKVKVFNEINESNHSLSLPVKK